MSLRNNILANYLSQFYVTLIGIVMVPVYIRYMGVEAYGLVGFYSMLQAWFMLLDMGLTPTMSREVARFRGGATDALTLRRLLRALEGIFIGVAILGGAAMIVGAESIASKWLKVEQLSRADVQHPVMLMAVIVGLRWVCGLYRGVINGFERLVWLSWFNIVIATARFVLVIPFFIFVGTSPTQFFAYQLAIALIEMVVLVGQTYRFLPKTGAEQTVSWQWEPLRRVLKFSLSIAFTSSLWVMVTQTDKLVLSNLLQLSDYAYFSLAVLAASGVLVISAPIGGAMLPRMTKMNAEGDDAGLIRLYRNASQFVAVIAVSTTLVLAFFAEQVLWAWTGNEEIVKKSAPVLVLYVLGNGISAIGTLGYFLQFAKGDLKLHLLETPLFLAVFLPSLLWLTAEYGLVGAGYAWLGTQAAFFTLWMPMIHKRYAKGLHLQWLLKDIGAVFALGLLAAVLGYVVVVNSGTGGALGRWNTGLLIALLGLVTLAASALGSRVVREAIRFQWARRFKA